MISNSRSTLASIFGSVGHRSAPLISKIPGMLCIKPWPTDYIYLQPQEQTQFPHKFYNERLQYLTLCGSWTFWMWCISVHESCAFLHLPYPLCVTHFIAALCSGPSSLFFYCHPSGAQTYIQWDQLQDSTPCCTLDRLVLVHSIMTRDKNLFEVKKNQLPLFQHQLILKRSPLE